MQCPACRHENPAQAKFCLECGARLVVSCSNCRAELPPSAKFCLECGERVMPSGAAMVSPSASPEAYTPKHLAERILTAKATRERRDGSDPRRAQLRRGRGPRDRQ